MSGCCQEMTRALFVHVWYPLFCCCHLAPVVVVVFGNCVTHHMNDTLRIRNGTYSVLKYIIHERGMVACSKPLLIHVT